MLKEKRRTPFKTTDFIENPNKYSPGKNTIVSINSELIIPSRIKTVSTKNAINELIPPIFFLKVILKENISVIIKPMYELEYFRRKNLLIRSALLFIPQASMISIFS